MTDLDSKASGFDGALAAFVARVRDDRTVLALIRLGSGRPETLWNSDELHCWMVIADGSAPRRRSDGDQPRIWRTFVEDDIDIQVELIERAKFKRMVEGNDRNTAGFSHFSVRSLVHCTDDGISRWFDGVNNPAARDRQHDQLAVACWIAHTARRVRRRLDVEQQLGAALGDAMELAHALAVLAVIDEGAIVEHRLMTRAHALQPELMQVAYTELLAQRTDAAICAAADAADCHLHARWEPLFEPVLRFLDRVGSPVALSELAEHFASSALHAGHLSSACEWMVSLDRLTKLSAPLPATKKSRVQLDEPAYTRA